MKCISIITTSLHSTWRRCCYEKNKFFSFQKKNNFFFWNKKKYFFYFYKNKKKYFFYFHKKFLWKVFLQKNFATKFFYEMSNVITIMQMMQLMLILTISRKWSECKKTTDFRVFGRFPKIAKSKNPWLRVQKFWLFLGGLGLGKGVETPKSDPKSAGK